jgi:hypothetical protein
VREREQPKKQNSDLQMEANFDTTNNNNLGETVSISLFTMEGLRFLFFILKVFFRNFCIYIFN